MTTILVRYLRRKLNDAGLYPHSRLGWITSFLLSIDVIIAAVMAILRKAAFPGAAAGLSIWVSWLTFIGCVLLVPLSLRWIRHKLMWRLRNRLIITYLFIGVIPVLLIAMMALLAAYLFAGQLAIYLATNDLHAQLDRLQAANETVAAELADEVKSGVPRHSAVIASGQKSAGKELLPGNRLQTYFGATPVTIQATALPANGDGKIPSGSLFQSWMKHSFASPVVDNDQLFLRAVTVVPVNQQLVVSVSSVPVDRNLLAQIWNNQAEVVFYTNAPVTIVSTRSEEATKKAIEEDQRKTSEVQDWPVLSGGSLPAQLNRADLYLTLGAGTLTFGSPLPIMDWQTGKTYDTGFLVRTRPSLLYARLFSMSTAAANAWLIALEGIAIVFAAIVFVAVVLGLGLTRTITRAVAALYRGTERVNRGDFTHRIPVKSNDQLAALESSFNSMTESLEKLIAEQKEKQRLESELAIAQEVQAQLFPRQEVQLTSLELHGICKPARTVSGDYYDFVPLGDERIALAVGDISGKGISAALLMATIHSAVRVYEFGGVPEREVLARAGAVATATSRAGIGGVELAVEGNGKHSPREVMWLLNRHLFHSTPAEKYATLFLGIYDGERRELTYSNAGHLPPLLLANNGTLRKLDTGGTVIGLFDEMEYEEKCVQLAPGDLFVAYSDGITEPENEFGEFGEARLINLLRENQHLPLPRLSEAVITAVQDWTGAGEQPDDITLVLGRVR
jgi:sigma-B regulation protein RsbU (phosphoserine phosphatase)